MADPVLFDGLVLGAGPGNPMRGQSLVEFALVLPIMLFLFLGFGEAAFLYSRIHAAQTAADTLADVAVQSPGESWNSIVQDELDRAECTDGIVAVEALTAGRTLVKLTCVYVPIVTNGLWPGLHYSVQGEAVIGP
jgi:Flp pilus assembly protein TadG